ncbi:centriole, cilia and spindle-associated protein [Clupea harengus]|uniref:Centriole, cilia and spindle-associated protein n=1 Tax=Clupea harengus TaxID=7950 RepID=A0A6P3W8G8_CLUHA|nr:centriole, cilia and spindle-associated protein [Clupea harengus]
MANDNKVVTRKIRSEYMKKFRDPKWSTFSKNYEDSVKYRLTRRVMEQTHNPLYGDGWDSGSESSGRSSPKVKQGLDPLIAKLQTLCESRNKNEDTEESVETVVNGHSTDPPSKEISSCTENGVPDETDHQTSSTEPPPRRRVRRRTPRSEPGYDGDVDKPRPSSAPKPSRAKSQPPERKQCSGGEHRPSYMRPGWAERHVETRGRTSSMRASVSAGEIHRSDTAAKRLEAQRCSSALDRRRARSADLEKSLRSELTVADRWTTEYMRCFSARLR